MGERFEAVLRPTGRTATYIEIPLDPRVAFGSGRARVRGTVNGAPYRTTLAKRGGGWYMVVNRAVREAAGAKAGDEVIVEMERDDEPRTVDIPDELRRALDRDPDVAGRFDALSYSHQKEFVDWIREAKGSETRERRIAKTVAKIRAGETGRSATRA